MLEASHWSLESTYVPAEKTLQHASPEKMARTLARSNGRSYSRRSLMLPEKKEPANEVPYPM